MTWQIDANALPLYKILSRLPPVKKWKPGQHAFLSGGTCLTVAQEQRLAEWKKDGQAKAESHTLVNLVVDLDKASE